MLRDIADDVSDKVFFSIKTDKATDNNNIEQLFGRQEF